MHFELKIIISRSSNPLVLEDDHHPAIEVSTDLSPLKFLAEKRMPKTNFFKANYVALNQELSLIDWASELNDRNVDDAVDRFYEILEPFIDSIPKTRVTVRDYPVFYTHDLILLIKSKANAKSSYEKERFPVKRMKLKEKFSNLRKQVKAETKRCFDNYVSDCEEKIQFNTKCFFAFTKSLKKTNSLPSCMKFNYEISNDRSSICNLFASSLNRSIMR